VIFRQARRNLVASRLRLALTSLAVVLGVGFVVGAFVLGDTINKAFDEVFSTAGQGVSVEVRGVETVSAADRQPVPEDLLARVQAVEGVRAAAGGYAGQAQIVGRDGEPAGVAGPPALGFSWVDDAEINPLRMISGAPPRAADEVVIDSETAGDEGFQVGERVRIITATGSAEYRLSGIATFGDSGSLAGATLSAFAPQTARRVFDASGFTTIQVASEPGVSQQQLAVRVGRVLPAGYEAITGEQATDEASDEFQVFVDIFRNALLVFAGIALFVGAFIIFNAFAITVAQRTRQVGLLRAVGASQRQVVGSVLVEALLIGVIASVVGILFGIGVAVGLQALFGVFGASLPETTLQVAARTVIVGLVVGVVVTMVAAVGPAIRASRVPPIAAMRDVHPTTRSRRRAIIATAVGGLGLGLVLLGTLGGGDATPRLTAIAVGAVLMFVGSGMLTQYVARPLASAIGLVVMRLGRTSGRLGRDNAMRNPRRTAQTASALTIGVALVAGVTVFASSLYQTFAGTLDERIRADVVVQDRGGAYFSPAAVADVGRVPEIQSVTAWRDGEFKDAAGDTQSVSGVDPSIFASVYDPEVVAGSLADLARPGAVAVSQDYATDNDLQVGDTLPVLLSRTGEQRWRVAAVFDDTSFGEFFISLPQYERDFTTQQDTVILARAADGVSADAAAEAVDRSLSGPYPNLDVYTKDEFKDFVAGQINQFLYLFYILLAMAVVIAVFGIVLTLALSVFERTREIGLLRAVGMSRRGVRAMIRWEAIIVALIGALVGLVLGVFLGVVAVRAVPDLDSPAIPWTSLVVFLVLAAVFGVLAAILPARRAARLDVLRAIQAE